MRTRRVAANMEQVIHRDGAGRFGAGSVANPGGRVRKSDAVRKAEALARERSPQSMRNLMRMADDAKLAPGDRIRCEELILAYGIGKPLIGVNHIEGHVYSVVFENPPVEYPSLALIVSGGHTNIFHIPVEGQYKVVSRTRDDAAGEAFDKVAKMLGLGYPGGPIIERLAKGGDPTKIRFSPAKISDGRPDLSFSGLKTAVAKYMREQNVEPQSPGEEPRQEIMDLAASFQSTVIRSLVGTMEKLAVELRPRTLIVAGGVACNEALRSAAELAGSKLGVPVYFPSKHLSTDNAAMIAAAGFAHLAAGERSGLEMTADVTMRLQNLENEDADLRRKKVRYRL